MYHVILNAQHVKHSCILANKTRGTSTARAVVQAANARCFFSEGGHVESDWRCRNSRDVQQMEACAICSCAEFYVDRKTRMAAKT